MATSTRKSHAAHTEPYVVHPSSAHTHTIILLHGLGSSGQTFGSELLAVKLSTTFSLAETFPSTKFMFPTATRNRCTAFHRSKINQWFDILSLDDPKWSSKVQIDGMVESVANLINIIEEEVKMVGAERVVLGGLSQGCAMGLMILLSRMFSRLGGFVGMSGRLPFRGEIDDVIIATRISEDVDDNGEMLITFGGDEKKETDPVVAVVGFVRDILALDEVNVDASFEDQQQALQTPVFLGHGLDDVKMTYRLGEEAAGTLSLFGLQLSFKGYAGLGHWYKVPEELDDVVTFLRANVEGME